MKKQELTIEQKIQRNIDSRPWNPSKDSIVYCAQCIHWWTCQLRKERPLVEYKEKT